MFSVAQRPCPLLSRRFLPVMSWQPAPCVVCHSPLQPGPSSYISYYFLIQNHIQKLNCSDLTELACFLPPIKLYRRTGIPTPDVEIQGTQDRGGRTRPWGALCVVRPFFTASPGPTESNLGNRLPPLSWDMSRRYKWDQLEWPVGLRLEQRDCHPWATPHSRYRHCSEDWGQGGFCAPQPNSAKAARDSGNLSWVAWRSPYKANLRWEQMCNGILKKTAL